ncbi:hypothetical protein V6N13_025557 [Hibiscus sabdariffa]
MATRFCGTLRALLIFGSGETMVDYFLCSGFVVHKVVLLGASIEMVFESCISSVLVMPVGGDTEYCKAQ